MGTDKTTGIISILIADDHLMFADGLRLLLQAQTDFFITGVANNGKDLLNILNKELPDIILLDINMPVMNGINALGYIRKKNYQARIIMLSTYNETHLVEKAKECGANGYLVKTFGPDELVKVIRAVYAGTNYFPAKKTDLPGRAVEEDPFLKQYNLTKREKEILLLIKEGLTNAQIGERLILSIYTVETHRKNIMQKLGLKSPGALMRYIIEHNL